MPKPGRDTRVGKAGGGSCVPGIELHCRAPGASSLHSLQALQTHVLQNLRSATLLRTSAASVQRRSGPLAPGVRRRAVRSPRRQAAERRVCGGGALPPSPAGPGSPAVPERLPFHPRWPRSHSSLTGCCGKRGGDKETAAQRLSPSSVTTDPGGQVHSQTMTPPLTPSSTEPRVTARHRPRPRPLAPPPPTPAPQSHENTSVYLSVLRTTGLSPGCTQNPRSGGLKRRFPGHL